MKTANQSAHEAVLARIGQLNREELEARFNWTPPGVDASSSTRIATPRTYRKASSGAAKRSKR